MKTKNIINIREEYEAPQIEIVDIDNEGILASSLEGFGDGGGYRGSGWE